MPAWLTPLLAGLKLDQELVSDAEDENPLMVFECSGTIDDFVATMNSLPFPWWIVDKMKGPKGDPLFLVVRLDVVCRKLLSNIRISSNGKNI